MGLKTKGQWGAGGALSGRVASRSEGTLEQRLEWGAGGALSGRVASCSEGTLEQRLECTQEPVHVGIWK